MTTHSLRTFLLCTAASVLAMPSFAQDAESDFWQGWSLNGSNTVRVEDYHNDGLRSASPYPFGGDQLYNEFNATASKRFSPYETLRGQFSGVLNSSDYRATDNGLVPERMNIFYENGESSTPFRIEAGDYYANITARTLQRSLKGAQVELQPGSDTPGRRHSIMLFSGAQQYNWRHFDHEDDLTTGASWMMDDTNWGTLTTNIMHNRQDFNRFGLTGLDDDGSHWIGSVGYNKELMVGTERWDLEGEVARLAGDTSGIPGMDNDTTDMAYFGQLTGGSTFQPRLSYMARYDHYGADYVPTGAIITPDYKGFEGHIGWRFDDGIQMRIRHHRLTNAMETFNPQKTNLIGLDFTGALLAGLDDQVTGRAQIYNQYIENELETVDQEAKVLSLNLSRPLWENTVGMTDLFIQHLDDNAPTLGDYNLYQLGFSLNRSFQWGEYVGSYQPGIIARTMNGRFSDSVEWQPTMTVSVGRGNHSLDATYGYYYQNREIFGIPDVGTQNASLDYRYRLGDHLLGLTAEMYDREQDLGLQDTSAYKLAAYWTYAFYHTPTTPVGDVTMAPALSLTEASRDAGLLYAMAPGRPTDTVGSEIKQLGIKGKVAMNNYAVYEEALLPGISNRQRLVTQSEGGKVVRSAIIIDFTGGSSAAMVQEYGRVREQLLRAYGAPSGNYELGDFTADMARDINSGEVIRVLEWSTPTGTIRFGIPRRLDRLVRMEVQHATSFPAPRDPLWSLNLR